MVRIEKMIMIGSTARQSGKTELAVRIIRTFSRYEKIVGVKITTVMQEDKAEHGSIALPDGTSCSVSPFLISNNTNKSTDRMLAAGAIKAVWIHTKFRTLYYAWNEDFYSWLDKKFYIVCESASLRRFVEPDIFIMIRNLEKKIKPRAEVLLQIADIVIDFRKGTGLDFDVNRIGIKNGKWIYRKV